MSGRQFVNIELLNQRVAETGMDAPEIHDAKGIGISTLRNVFRGMVPQKMIQFAIAEALSCRVTDLFPINRRAGESDDPNNAA